MTEHKPDCTDPDCEHGSHHRSCIVYERGGHDWCDTHQVYITRDR